MALYYVSGPQQDAEAQMLLSDIITIDESNYYMLLSAMEMIERVKAVPAIVRTAQQQQILALEPTVIQLAQEYAARQNSLKQKSWIDNATQAVKSGWEWLVSKFSAGIGRPFIPAIGAFPLIPVAIIAAIVTAGGATAYIVTELADTRRKAETDQSRISTALDAMLKVPGVQAEDIAALVTSLPTTNDESAFDKAISLAKWGGFFAFIIWGASQFKKAKPAAA